MLNIMKPSALTVCRSAVDSPDVELRSNGYLGHAPIRTDMLT